MGAPSGKYGLAQAIAKQKYDADIREDAIKTLMLSPLEDLKKEWNKIKKESLGGAQGGSVKSSAETSVIQGARAKGSAQGSTIPGAPAKGSAEGSTIKMNHGGPVKGKGSMLSITIEQKPINKKTMNMIKQAEKTGNVVKMNSGGLARRGYGKARR
jgi:hypothetical protein